MSRTVWIQEIQVGFTNFWNSYSEVYIEPSCVIVEAEISENETLWTCTLDKIDDKGFSNFGVTVYGACWLSFLNRASSYEINTLIQSHFNSLKLMKAIYVKFRIRNKTTIFQNSKNFKTFVSWSSSLISKKRNFDSVTANSLVY